MHRISSFNFTSSAASSNHLQVNRFRHVLICSLTRSRLLRSERDDKKRNIAARLGTRTNRPWHLVDPVELSVDHFHLYLDGPLFKCSDIKIQLAIPSSAESGIIFIGHNCTRTSFVEIGRLFIARSNFIQVFRRKKLSRMDIDTRSIRCCQRLSYRYAGRERTCCLVKRITKSDR